MEDKIIESTQGNISDLFHLNQNITKSQEILHSYLEKNEIKFNSSSDITKENYYLNNNDLIKENDIQFNLSNISNKSYEDKDDDSFNDLFKKNKNLLSIEKIIEINNYLVEFYEGEIFSENKIIRCFHDEENEKEKCHCIPIIKKRLYGMEFSCDNKDFKFLETENIIKLIYKNKLFEEIQSDNKNNKIIKITDEKKENTIIIKKGNFYIEGKNKIKEQKYANNLYKDFRKKIDRLIKKYRIILSDFNNNNKNQNDELQRKIKNIFFTLMKYINNFIYCLIIKRLVKESLELENNDKNIENILLNLEIAESTLKYIDKKDLNDKLFSNKNKYKKNKLNWIIPFYFKEEIKDDLDKNIFIAISFEGNVFLYLLNSNGYKLINMKKIEGLNTLVKLTKLRNIMKSDKINNYFLISSIIFDTALIINVLEESDKNLDERFKINIFQKIKIEGGLYSSIEIDHKGKNYLLNYHKTFDLWLFNENKNQIESKEIMVNETKSEDNFDKKRIYGPLIQGKINKNLIITQMKTPVNLIEVYLIDEIDGKICLNQKSFTRLDKKDNYFAIHNNNYHLYKDRYLLLAAIDNKLTKKNGGIYLFDIEKNQTINFFQFKNVTSVNCIIKKNDNTLICSSGIKILTPQISFNEGGLFILKIIEDNNQINLVMSENGIFEGKNKYLQCGDFLFENYFTSSSMTNNAIIKINENNLFLHYYNIYYPGNDETDILVD